MKSNLYERLAFLQTNLSRAKGRKDGKEFDISKWYLEELYQKQNGKCALSGVELEFERGGTYWGGKWCNPKSCTIDRIKNGLGYVKGNVQLVTWEVNATKNHLWNEDFIELCEKVASYQKLLMESVDKPL